MCGSSPLPPPVTASTGIGTLGCVGLRDRGDALLHRRAQLRVRRTEVGRGARGRVVGIGTSGEPLGPFERLADQLGPDDGTVRLDEAAVGAGSEQALTDPRDRQRDRRYRAAPSGPASIRRAAINERRISPHHQTDHQVDHLDADERRDHAAEPVDRRGCAAASTPPSWACTARRASASGISATMIRALKITADRIAELGTAQLHHVEPVEPRDRPPRTSPG